MSFSTNAKLATFLLGFLMFSLFFVFDDSLQNADAVSINCPSISGWTTYNQFQGTSSSYTCEYESTPDPIYGTDYASLWLEWHDPVPQYVDPGSGSWCSGDTSGGTHYSSTRYVLVGFDQYYSEFSSAGKTMLNNAESLNIGASCTTSSPTPTPTPTPTPSPPPSDNESYEWNKKGNELFDQGRYTEALDAYEKARQYNPNDSIVHRNIANTLKQLERYGEALTAANKALQINPNYASAWNIKAVALKNLQRYDEALSAFDKAISLDPSSKWPWNNKGYLLNDLEKYEEALVALNQALRLDPNYEGAYFEKGYALGELGRYQESIQAYQKELQLDPTDKAALLNLGWTLNELGKYEEAVTYFNRALKIDPNYTLAQKNKQYSLEQISKKEAPQTEYDTWIKQGTYDLTNGNFDEAIRNFDLAYKQNPNDQNLINLKADALKKKGMALVEDGKFDLGVVFLGESDYLKPDAFVKASQNNAYNLWSEEIKKETVHFDPNVIDEFNKYDVSTIKSPPLPTVGKAGSTFAVVNRDGTSYQVKSDNTPGNTAKLLVPGAPLNVGDVIFVPSNKPPFIIDWGYATTTVKPGSVFLIGTHEDLQTFAKGNPHYVELIKGQLRLHDDYIDLLESSEKVCFNLKTEKNLNRACGTDVTFSHDKTTGVSSIQIDDGTVQVYDVISDTIKEYGVGTKLVTNNDGYFLEQAAAQPEHETMVTEMQEKSENLNGGGCLIATATFGSELAPQVQQLRELRDNTLLKTESGSAFMIGFNEFYYSFSPTIADWERENPAFKEMVKIAITPMMASLSILNYVDMNSESSVLGYGISLIILNVGMYFVAPAIVIVGIKKRF